MSFTIYQAGPLFSEAERDWYNKLTLQLEKAGHIVVCSGDLFPGDVIGKAGKNGPGLIFQTRCNAIDQCNCVVALLDGVQVDDGTAWEIGYAYAKGLPVCALRTDVRKSDETAYNRINSMIEGCLTGFADNIPTLLDMLALASDDEVVAEEAKMRGF